MLLFILLPSDLEKKKKKVEARCGRWGQGIKQLTSRRTCRPGLPATFPSPHCCWLYRPTVDPCFCLLPVFVPIKLWADAVRQVKWIEAKVTRLWYQPQTFGGSPGG